MGDLIGSETTDSVERLHQQFNDAIASANKRKNSGLVSPLTITLGDEFQGLYSSLTCGLSAIQAMRQQLLGQDVECRFVLGAVSIATPVNRVRAWNMMGAGLAGTRDKLGDKRHPSAYRFFIPRVLVIEPLLETIGHSLTVTERSWTPRQREVVAASLVHEQGVQQLAAGLQLQPRTLYKIRSAAHYELYSDQWQALKTAIAALDQHYGFA